jgi:hypothetical protein
MNTIYIIILWETTQEIFAFGYDCQEMSQKPSQIMSKFHNHCYISLCGAHLMTCKPWDVELNEKYGCWEF